MHDITGRPQVGQPLIGTRPYRVLRGGSWNNNNNDNYRSAYRNNNWPDNRNNNIGFRVVLAAPSTLLNQTPCPFGAPCGMKALGE